MGYSFTIGSFNVRKLSYATKDEDLGDNVSVKRAYSDIGQIVCENCDVVALQEINFNNNALRMLFPYGSGWAYRSAQTRSKVSDSDEGYAFAWNTKKLRLMAEPVIWTQYRKDPVLDSQGLLRHPYYGRFTPAYDSSLTSSPHGPACEIRLINTHIRFRPKANNDLDEGAIALRRREFSVLAGQILDKLTILDELTDKRYGDNYPAYTFLCGDYNLNLDNGINSSPYVIGCLQTPDGKEIVTVQDKLTTLKRRQVINETTGEKKWVFEGFANNYDHFSFNKTYLNSQEIKLKSDIIDSVCKYRNGDFEKHWREISDHIPIILKVDL